MIKTITTGILGIAVNCYLVQARSGFFLVDTGLASKQAGLKRELDLAGCKPGDMKLMVDPTLI